MPQLLTNWIRIATAGNSIDGRVIPVTTLEEMADNYKPDEYTARIWPDHRRWYGAWGDVVALKMEEWQGKKRLFARLRPNSQLMQANEMDQKVFCSIEIDIKDFDGTGKHYLAGLGVTDEPGSLGCEKLKFCKNKNKLYSELEHFVIEEVTKETTEQSPNYQKVLNFPKPDQLTVKDTDVTEEQLKAALQDAVQGINLKIDEIERKFSAQRATTPTESVVPAPVTPAPLHVKTSLSVEQFSAELEKALKPVTEKLEKLEGLDSKFNQLLQESPGQRPGGEGSSSSGDIW